MKKLYTMLMMAMMALTATTMTSCDEDSMIAYTLEGTWQGNMYVSSYYGGRNYYATQTEITFDRDPFRWSSGYGYWVDYYSNAPWDYVANHITWRVDNTNIVVDFREDGNSVVISDYRLNDNFFTGYIADNGNNVKFSLHHISSPNWDNYRYWGYDGWNDYYYYSRATRSEAGDSLTTPTPVITEKPVRQFGVQH